MSLLADLIDRSEDFDRTKVDFKIEAPGMWYDRQARMNLSELPIPLEPTEWASRQLYAKLGPIVYGRGKGKPLPFDYLHALPAQLRATVLNDHLQAARDKQWLVRAYGTRARAVLDGDYPIVSNTELLQAMDALIDAEDGRFPGMQLVRPSVTPDDLNLKIVWRNVDGRPGHNGQDRSPYGIGVYLGHGEVGNRKLRLLPQVQVHSCTNSVMLDTDSESLVLSHRGSLASIMVLLKAALGRVLRSSAQLLDRLILAENERIEDMSAVLDGLALEYGWSADVSKAVAFGTGGRKTRAGLVSGVTYAAHTVFEDPNDQADMEVLGGRILVADWSLFGRAAEMARLTQRLPQNSVMAMALRN